MQVSLAPNATVGDLRDLIASDLGQVCVLNPKPEGAGARFLTRADALSRGYSKRSAWSDATDRPCG
ncbi:MAG: hypothetical protein ACPIOQ_16405 [Promethearchaeia archaeon]